MRFKGNRALIAITIAGINAIFFSNAFLQPVKAEYSAGGGCSVEIAEKKAKDENASYYDPDLWIPASENELILCQRREDYFRVVISGDAEGEVVVPSEIGDTPVKEFVRCYSMSVTSVEMPDTVTRIDEDAFFLCYDLESIKLPNNLEEIEKFAFGWCEKLTSIDLPDSLQSIGDCAFAGTGITSFTIPKNVNSIGNAVCQSNKVEKFDVDKENNFFSEREGVLLTKDYSEIVEYPPEKKDEKFIIPQSVKIIREAAIDNDYLKELVVSSNVEKIEEYGVVPKWKDESCKITILNSKCEIYDSENTIYNSTVATGEKDDDGYDILKSVFLGTIYAYDNSTAQAYAEKYGYKFETITGEVNVAFGDPTGDGKIDAKDSSFVLVEYAKLSTGDESALSEDVKSAADVNKDSKIDSKDASAILSYYAYVSTGGTDSIQEFLKTE